MIIKSWLPEEDRNSHDHHSCTHSQLWATCNKREYGQNNIPPLNVGTHLHSIDAIRKSTSIKVSLPALSNRAYITLHRPALRLVSMTVLESSSKTWLSSSQSRLAIIMVLVPTPLEGTEAGLIRGDVSTKASANLPESFEDLRLFKRLPTKSMPVHLTSRACLYLQVSDHRMWAAPGNVQGFKPAHWLPERTPENG